MTGRLARLWVRTGMAIVAVAASATAAGSARAQVSAAPVSGLTSNGAVTTMAAGPGNVLYVSGGFERLAMRSGHWVRFDGPGVRTTAWPEVDGPVHAVVADGAGGWFIGGEFAHVAGQPRAGLAHVGSMRVHALAAVLAAALLAPAPATAAPGDLDSTFGGSGIQVTHFGPESAAFAIAIQPDGKIVSAGTSNYEQDSGLYLGEFGVSRHNADGSLDESFSGDGRQTTSFGPGLGAYAQRGDPGRRQDRGRGVSARRMLSGRTGTSPRPLRRRRSLDATFRHGADGGVERAVAIQADGKIVVAGGAALVRLNADGSLDPGFSDDRKVSTGLDAQAMAIQADGKIVLAGGYGFRLARYRADGALDPSFSGGNVNTDLPGMIYARSVALQADGRIVVAGGAAAPTGGTDFAMVRYHADGALDTAFGTGGRQTAGEPGVDDFAAAVAVQPNGKIVVTGQSAPWDWNAPVVSRITLARFGADGSPDGSFGTGGKVSGELGFSSHATAVALQPDGKIVLAGIGTTYESGSSMLIGRYQGDTPAAANVAPTARYAFSCSGLTCYLDARTSSDPDGPVTGYRWDFSDGTSATDSYVRKVFAQYGTYSATLTVTDGPGATGTRVQTLTLLRLTATGSLVGGLPTVRLSWNGTPGTVYSVYRGSKRVALVSGNTLTDRPPIAATGTYSFTVCEAFGSYCSATETVRIPGIRRARESRSARPSGGTVAGR